MESLVVGVVFMVGAYLLGSTPTGQILAKWLKNVDLKKVGSGSTGATNVGRVLGFKWAALVAFLDFLKGFVPVWMALLALNNYPLTPLSGETMTDDPTNFTIIWVYLVGIATVVGHIFSIFLKFNGGKGVAASGGVLFAFHPLFVLIALAALLAITFLTKTKSIASLAVLIVINGLIFWDGSLDLWFVLSLDLLVIFAHRENILRLWKKKELAVNREN